MKGTNHPVEIVVIDRGWVAVGNVSMEHTPGVDGQLEVVITNGACVRNWGTQRGLGEIAEEGPTDKTILDPFYGTLRVPYPSKVIFRLECNQEKWRGKVK